MKEITEKYYCCSICGKVSKNEQKIIECEAAHCVIDEETKVALHYKKGQAVPDYLVMNFSNGAEAEFYCNWIRKQPEGRKNNENQ